MPLGQVAVGLALRDHESVVGYRLTPPGVKDEGHLPGEGLPGFGELSAAQQGLDHDHVSVAPAGELSLGTLPDLSLWRDSSLVPPETADSEERVGTLEQAAGRPRIGTPWRVITPAVVWPCQ